MYIRLHVKCPLFLLDFNKFEFPGLSLQKQLRITFYENPSSGSRTDGRTNTKRLLVTFRNVANAPRSRPLPSIFLVIVLHFPFFIFLPLPAFIFF